MHLTAFVTALLAAVVSARDFTLYDDPNFGGASHFENRFDDDACWNMNGAGDKASSVRGAGCTTFFQERDCQGSSWQNYGDASTVPEFLNDHIWSFRNKCYGCPDISDPCQRWAAATVLGRLIALELRPVALSPVNVGICTYALCFYNNVANPGALLSTAMWVSARDLEPYDASAQSFIDHSYQVLYYLESRDV
ncbi:hypothetical protein DL765_010893 [Monosporascus sp. GIB2]|nr:hypothetical protein DL765_010893 [Monosporascus sp. GIB2]